MEFVTVRYEKQDSCITVEGRSFVSPETDDFGVLVPLDEENRKPMQQGNMVLIPLDNVVDVEFDFVRMVVRDENNHPDVRVFSSRENKNNWKNDAGVVWGPTSGR